jgi:hypothetical protein
MDPPFLELAFYVGIDKAGDALTAVTSKKVSHEPARGSRLIGLGNHEEEVLSRWRHCCGAHRGGGFLWSLSFERLSPRGVWSADLRSFCWSRRFYRLSIWRYSCGRTTVVSGGAASISCFICLSKLLSESVSTAAYTSIPLAGTCACWSLCSRIRSRSIRFDVGGVQSRRPKRRK